MKDWAVAYATAGYPVLRVYAMEYDEEERAWVCACWHERPGFHPEDSDGKPANSPGKHPLFGSSGAHDATTDLAVIETWPENGYNLGIAGTDTRFMLDLDHLPTVRKLEAAGLFEGLANSGTGGGGRHIYCQGAPTTNGVLKDEKTGEHLGEVRAANYYVVAPPSIHYTGRSYEWLGPNPVEHGPMIIQTDGWSYATELLAKVGVTLAARRNVSDQARPSAIPAIELPWSTGNATLKGLLDPYYPDSDRSNALFRLACELFREVRATGQTVEKLALAGVVKHVDLARPSSKFSWRTDADDRYWQLILKAEAEVAAGDTVAPMPEPVTGPNSILVTDGDAPHPAGLGTYYYDKKAGFIDNRDPKHPHRICNFEALIREELTTWDDGMTDGKKADWAIELRQADKFIELRVPNENHHTASGLESFIAKHVPATFIVEEKMGAQLRTGMMHYSALFHGGNIPVRQTYGATGWVQDKDAFLLPGAPGAITGNGFDLNMRYENRRTESISRFFQFGTNVQPNGSDLAATLRALYTLREPHIMVPLLTQILAAPFASLGMSESPVAVHLFARTGSFKSTIARIAMSLFGQFSHTSNGIESWTSTATSLNMTMARTRDLPLLIDDFKLSAFGRHHPIGPILSVIQNYADHTARTKSSRDQTEQKWEPARCLLISTGEDTWEGQQSVASRTLIVDTRIPKIVPGTDDYDPEQLAALKHKLTALQGMADRGDIGAVGYAWLQWLTSRGQVWLRDQLATRRAASAVAVSRMAIADQHARVAASCTQLIAASWLFRDFLAEVVPSFVEEQVQIERIGWAAMLVSAAEQAQEAQSFSPYRAIQQVVLDALTSGRGQLAPRVVRAVSVGMQLAEVIGFVDDDAVYLSENTTLGWYRREMRGQGLDPVIGWKALVEEAKHEHRAQPPKETAIYGQPTARLLRIPRSEFLPERIDISVDGAVNV